MTDVFIVCHFLTCFATLITFIVGLTRKDEAKIKPWQLATRVCWAIMLAGGAVLESATLPLRPLHAVIKCALGLTTIYLIEKTYGYRRRNELNRGRAICVFSSYALTVICGLALLILTKK